MSAWRLALGAWRSAFGVWRLAFRAAGAFDEVPLVVLLPAPHAA